MMRLMAPAMTRMMPVRFLSEQRSMGRRQYEAAEDMDEKGVRGMDRTGLEDYYLIRDNRKLRFGYTTGSCAAAAAKAAALMLFSGHPLHTVDLMTPKGILLHLRILNIV